MLPRNIQDKRILFSGFEIKEKKSKYFQGKTSPHYLRTVFKIFQFSLKIKNNKKKIKLILYFLDFRKDECNPPPPARPPLSLTTALISYKEIKTVLLNKWLIHFFFLINKKESWTYISRIFICKTFSSWVAIGFHFFSAHRFHWTCYFPLNLT